MTEAAVEEGVEEQAEALPELPEGWEWRPLASLLSSLETGKRPKGGVAGIESGVPSIGGEHLRPDGTISLETVKFVPRDFFESLKKGVIQRGDVLIVKDGATTGKTALVNDRFEPSEAAVNEHVFICRAGEEVTPEFLFFYLWSSDGQKQIQGNIQGAAQGGITRAFAEKVFVPTPRVELQLELVSRVMAPLGEISELETELDVVENLQNQFRQAMLRDAFSGRLTRGDQLPEPSEVDEDGRPILPDGWVWEEIEKVGEVIRGVTFKKAESSLSPGEGLLPVLRSGNVQQELIIGQDLVFVPESKIKDSQKLRPGDIVVSVSNSDKLLGKAARLAQEFDGSFGAFLSVIRPNARVNPKYLGLFTESASWRQQISQVASATNNISNINMTKLKALQVPLPARDEQDVIVAEIESSEAQTNVLRQELEEAKRAVDNLRASLLHQAFTGQLIA